MPQAKLTLRLDEELIAWGKAYAKTKGTSLSNLLEATLRKQRATANQFSDEDLLPPNRWGIRVPKVLGESLPYHVGPVISDEEAKFMKYQEYLNLE